MSTNFSMHSETISPNFDMQATPTLSSATIALPQQTPRNTTPLPRQMHNNLDHLQFQIHSDQTTLVLGVLSHLNRLECEVTDMKNFINMGFRKFNDAGNGELSMNVENIRLQKRNWNRAAITELYETFQTLPFSNGKTPEDIPTTGEGLRSLTHKGTDYLLDLYDIPFVPSMFLIEKKILYLRFLGANRVVMHRILD